MWQAIGVVSSGLTLAAFLAAVGAWVFRQKQLSRVKLIETAEPADRARLVEIALEVFHIDAANLSRERQYQLAIAQIKERARRFQVSAMLIGLIAILTAIVALVAIQQTRPEPVKASTEERVLNQWLEEHDGFVRSYGLPGPVRHRVSIWYQFFQNGLILFNVTDQLSWIFRFKQGKYTTVANPTALLTQHGEGGFNEPLFKELFRGSSAVRDKYFDLLQQREIIGGIGTIFVREDLLADLGQPLQFEQIIQNVLFVHGPLYDLVVNVVNSHSDGPTNDLIRGVIVLKPNGKFLRDTVWMKGGSTNHDTTPSPTPTRVRIQKQPPMALPCGNAVGTWATYMFNEKRVTEFPGGTRFVITKVDESCAVEGTFDNPGWKHQLKGIFNGPMTIDRIATVTGCRVRLLGRIDLSGQEITWTVTQVQPLAQGRCDLPQGYTGETRVFRRVN